jgi:hypothetical protein
MESDEVLSSRKLVERLTSVSSLREALGNSSLMATAWRLARVLSRGGIPHLIVGGLAVQEHGYVRATVDVDIVVPDTDLAREYLSIRGFQEVAGTRRKMVDRANRVDVDLLPGGGSVGPSVVSLPMPDVIGDTPTFIDVAGLITQKLSSYIKNPLSRLRDGGDVVELIKHAQLSFELPVDAKVKDKYQEMWQGLQASSQDTRL